jgi:hypothetical protein
MMATHANYSLQLVVESLFTGAKQVASATIPNESFKLIVKYTKTSLHFRKDCGKFCEGEWVQHRQLDEHNDLIGLISLVGFGVISFVGLICLISLVGLSLNGLIG